MTKRIFVSVDLPATVKTYLQRQQVPEIRWIRWMTTKNFHITLNFLGDLGPEKLEKVRVILQKVIPGFAKFTLTLSEFKGERDMLWLLPKRSAELETLRDALNEEFAAERVGKTERRRYDPHIMMGKSKTGRRMTWMPENFSPQSFMVDRINLYESELTPAAATHTLIESYPLLR